MEKRESFASKRKKKRKANKKRIYQVLSIFMILLVVFLFDVNSPKANNEENLSYKVYLNSEYLGRISNPEIIYSYLDETAKQYSQDYDVKEIYTPEDFQIVPEVLKDSYQVDDELVLDRFKKRSNFEVDSFKVTIVRKVLENVEDLGKLDEETEEGDSELVYETVETSFTVLSRDDFEKALERYIRLFVDEADYERIMNNQPLPEIIEEEYMLFNFYLDADITIQRHRANIDNLLKDEEQIVNYLLFRSPTIESQKEYTVKQGDTVKSIGLSQQMTVDELILLNDEVKTRETILAEGQVLNVTQTNPVLHVINQYYLTTREVIPHQTKVEYDPSRWSYKQSWVKEEGQDGERKVNYIYTALNGEIQQGVDVESSEVTDLPVTRVVVKGSKTSSRIGTGYFGWPTISRRVSAYYGWYRPFGKLTFHYGVDITGRYNDPIYAADNGVVSYVGYNKYGGYKVEINHNNGFKTVYAHMSGWPLVAKGAVVNKGAHIGRMGKSGMVTGTHLHIEIWKNGVRVNPYSYIMGWR